MHANERVRVGHLGATLLVVVALLLGGCGSPQPATPVGTTSSATTAALRYANVEIVHTTIGGEPRVRLRTVIEGGGEVMTAIGSDADTGESGELGWTSMRAALLVQLKSAMRALGWQEIGSGPPWWQVRFRGDANAKIPVIAPTEEPAAPTSPTEEPIPPTEEPTALPEEPTSPPSSEEPVPGPGDLGDAGYLVSLIGKDIDDPAVSPLVRACGGIGQNLHTNLACQDQGFELTVGSGLRIVDITLYAEQPGTYGEYIGALPLGITWDDSYYDLLDKLGPPEHRVGGNGVTINLQYPAGGAWLVLATSATHDRPEYLANARLLSIQITLRPTYTFPTPEPVDPDWSD